MIKSAKFNVSQDLFPLALIGIIIWLIMYNLKKLLSCVKSCHIIRISSSFCISGLFSLIKPRKNSNFQVFSI
ncbi:hypothetical protein C2G38_2066577 [Gigaspora rosea]|uniref:Uncharacterized protein n=1 Tax=Gigaspora rosea TaxID=44941 RepID=A0A397VTC0_9GLOM|nr:hypothetical protein C2G38_2066577 [Gigaspora rosea]